MSRRVLGRVLRRLFTRTRDDRALQRRLRGARGPRLRDALVVGGASRGDACPARAAAAFAVIAASPRARALLTRLAVTALLALLGGADLDGARQGARDEALLRHTRLRDTHLRRLSPRDGQTGTRRAPRLTTCPEPELSVTLVAVDGARIEFLDLRARQGARAQSRLRLRERATSRRSPSPPLHVNPAVWTTRRHGRRARQARRDVLQRAGDPGARDSTSRTGPASGSMTRSWRRCRRWGSPSARRSSGGARRFPPCGTSSRRRATSPASSTGGARGRRVEFHGFLVTDRMYPKLQAAEGSGRRGRRFEAEVLSRSDSSTRLKRSIRSSARRSPTTPLPRRRTWTASPWPRSPWAGASTARSRSRRYISPASTSMRTPSPAARIAAASMADAARLADGASSYWTFLEGSWRRRSSRRARARRHRRRGPRDDQVPRARAPGDARRRASCSWREGRSARGGRAGNLCLVDITPAAMYLLGFPVSAEMDGRVPIEAFDRTFVAPIPCGRCPPSAGSRSRPAEAYSVDARACRPAQEPRLSAIGSRCSNAYLMTGRDNPLGLLRRRRRSAQASCCASGAAMATSSRAKSSTWPSACG